jgi:predicted amidohydrolase YtcJ
MRFKKGFLALGLGLLFINLGCTENDSADNKGAESIYINGKIYTAKDKDSFQQAIAIAHDGTIIKVGSNEEIKKIADSNTQVFDLDHKVLMPGLIDSHIHALASGVEAILATMDSSDTTINVSKVEAKLRQSSLDGTGVAGDVLFLNGLSSEYWELADQLSNVFNNNEWKDRPIALVGSDHHTAWANQALLKKAGIDANFIQQLTPRGTAKYCT